MTVYAIETAKTLTVHLNPNGGQVTQNTMSVTYDQSYALEKPVHEEYAFDTWKFNTQNVALTGI